MLALILDKNYYTLTLILFIKINKIINSVFSDKVKKYSITVSRIFLLIVSLYTVMTSVNLHIKSINFPYQLEYREGAVLPVTEHYIKNENPYNIIFQPQNTYAYGFLYPLIVSPAAEIFGNTLAVHRWVTYIFILLTCLLIFLTLLRMKVNLFFSFTAAIIIHQSLVFNGLSSIARPEGLGIFLYLLGIILPWRYNFSKLSLAASIILGIAGYLTKPYYILVIPCILIYLFIFVSKRKALIYGITSLLSVFLMAVIANVFYETYHNNTFFHHNNTASYKFNYMTEQLLSYSNVNIFLLAVIFLSFIIFIKNTFVHQKIIQNDNTGNKFIFSKNFNILKNEPLLNTRYDLLFAFVVFFTVLLFVIKLGGHQGNFKGAYLFHLTSSFLILLTFQLIKSNKNIIYQLVVTLILIVTLLTQFKPADAELDKQINDCKITEDVIAKSNNVLNTSETVSIMIQQHKPVYDSGHSEYFFTGINKLSNYLNISKDVEKRNNDFMKELNEKISNKEFDLVLISQNTSVFNYLFFDWDIFHQNYKLNLVLNGPLSKIEVWYPVK